MSAGRFAGEDTGAAGPITIIGVDCATVPSRTGLARAVRTADGWHLLDVNTCSEAVRPEVVVAKWLSDEPSALLAVDAPLGWPAELGEAIVTHKAGEALSVPPARMFRRATDRFVHERLHKKPLDVGADKIAHTAWSALRLLGELRGSTGHDLPLTWSAAAPSLPAAIEVYPAATLVSHGLPSTGYKAPRSAARTAIQKFINRSFANAEDFDAVSVSEHALDAVLCVVAGLDFVAGNCFEPDEGSVARREGWIWVKVAQPNVRLPGDHADNTASRTSTASERRGVNNIGAPERFEFFIGGYGGPSYGVSLVDEELVYEKFGYGFQLSEEDVDLERLPPINPNWRTFRRAMDRLDVWAWKPRYEAQDPITDGTNWSLLVQWRDDFVETGGSNAYPGSDGPNPSKVFLRLLSALRRLVGGREIR